MPQHPLSLTAALRLTPEGPDRFAGEIPDGWQQGRGAFGGLVLGLLARAGELSAESPDRRLRTLTAAIPSPVVTGPVELSVERVRSGSQMSTVLVRMMQQNEFSTAGEGIRSGAVAPTVAFATLVFGQRRNGDPPRRVLSAPEAPPPSGQPLTPAAGSMTPVFTANFQFRNVGPAPFAGSVLPTTAGWIHAATPIDAHDAGTITAHVDAWWPAIFSIEPRPRLVATSAFTLDILVDPREVDPTRPLFHRATSLTDVEGYSIEMRELWTDDGRLAAINHQTFVLIR